MLPLGTLFFRLAANRLFILLPALLRGKKDVLAEATHTHKLSKNHLANLYTESYSLSAASDPMDIEAEEHRHTTECEECAAESRVADLNGIFYKWQRFDSDRSVPGWGP